MTEVRIATGFLERACGLMRKGADGGELLIVPCHDVHTFGLKRPIDVAFLDRRGIVVKAGRDVPPCSRMRCRTACAVVERWAREEGGWYEVGQQVGLSGLQRERG